MKILCRKTLAGALFPVDEIGRSAVSHLSVNDIVSVEFKRPRNLGHHRKFFALVNLIYLNQTRYRSPEELLDAIKIYTGHCFPLRLRDGTEVRVPKSIAFSKMDQAAFEEFWDRVVKVVCEMIIPGLKRADLEREILDLVA